jgi:hypothetical protein
MQENKGINYLHSDECTCDTCYMFPNRHYVVVCVRHMQGKAMLLFWGEYTPSNTERSFGGYTYDLNKCEKYSLRDLEGHGFHQYTKGCNWRKFDDFYISVDRLGELGQKMTVIYL